MLKDKKQLKIEKVVWMETETYHKKMEIKEVIKIKSLGFQSIKTGFIEAKKSDEKRNDITGAYD